ncbi:MAG: 50S ribosomal protein L20 [Patescibacteria group bacterium]|nr:50S ribosomal protein L20 [Patescibacteria group bacterium]
MPRVKRGVGHNKKRRTLLKQVKGYKWGRKNLIKLARTARTKAGAHAYRDRRKKKRDMRALWQVQINAFVREHDFSYSKFIGALKAANIAVDRKILADLAINNKKVLAALLSQLKK